MRFMTTPDMKATLFGATGKTGKHLIDEGLKRGMDLTVLVRSSSPFDNADVRMAMLGTPWRSFVKRLPRSCSIRYRTPSSCTRHLESARADCDGMGRLQRGDRADGRC